MTVLVARLYRMKRNVRVYFFSSFPLLFIIAGIAMGGGFNYQVHKIFTHNNVDREDYQ